MKPFFYFLFIAAFFSLDNQLQAQCNGVSESDSLELVKFYEALGGDDWTNNSGWLVEPVKEWFGVTVSEDGCWVERIFLSNKKLRGNIPNLNLPKLTYLNLVINNLEGAIPNFSNIPNLKHLSLSQNNLTGSIPNFSNLPNLVEVYLHENNLSGNIPNFSNLPKLVYLYLSRNQLNGSIPNFNYTPKLSYVYLFVNKLSGDIPDFSNLPKLKVLYLGSNQLSGTIPNFSKLLELETLGLGGNKLNGIIPNFSNLPNLKGLNLSDNELSDTIPDFSNLPNLKGLNLSSNQLSGTIPDFSNISMLNRLVLEENLLSGIIPNFTNLGNLEELILSFNELVGTIPEYSLPNLEVLEIEGNKLSGTIPDLLSFPKLEKLNLIDNHFTGIIPDFSKLPDLKILLLSDNELEGNIPDFSNLLSLEILELQRNQLNGFIPNFNNTPNLLSIDFSENHLTGVIPNFSNTPNLSWIILRTNKLTGYIPNFSKLPNLHTLYVCPNDLIGTLPALNLHNYYFPCLQTPILTGTAFHDQNQNCLQDEGEEPLKNTKITTNDNQFSTFTDENGFYTLQLDTGTYQITAIPPNFLWSENCPESYTVTFENYTDIIPNQNFGFTIEDECTLLTIDVASPLQRRCFKNTYTVSYCNEGTRTADNPFIELTFPDELIPLDASIPYSQDGNVFTFDLEALAIGGCGSFVVTDSVSCEAVLGSAACVEGRIYPAFLCRDVDSLWDGSDIVVEGECIESEYIQFTLHNEGEDMQDSVEYRIYENDVLTSKHNLQLMEGESTELSFAATGATYRLKAEQTDFHPSESQPQVVVELCGDAPYALGFVTSQPNSDLEHFIDIDCQEIIGSFDPNDKSVHPTGIAAQNYIEEGTELTYKIRFQNTGNDTAFRVTIIDTLQSEFLDLRSFKILSASHSYDARITDQNVLIVEFNNILLPDSTTNELESHGFVQYRITPFQDAPKKSIITNLGDIYFDYNQPITTNTVFNTIGIPELDVTLPIELLQFDAYLDKNQNAQLTWITASEINNSHFEVQRSSKGKNFEAIGKMAGKGTTSSLQSYQFEDGDLPSSTPIVYYRLKQTDFNGQFTFSKVIALSLQNEHTAKVWYNNSQNRLEVIAASSLQLQIFDAVGRLVKSAKIIEGRQTVDLQGLESGVYAYRLLQGEGLQMEVGQNGKILVVGN
ncbi:MAG: leucine-rich repeat domain-containing protein [Chitinophagales bacterium]